MHYLDHAATTPMLPEAVDAVAAALRETGNPSSLHAAGRRARRVVEESRERLAAAVGAKPYEVVFTGGGTEADNLAVKGVFWARRDADPRRRVVLASAVEHHAVVDSVEWLERHEGAEARWLPVDAYGRVHPDTLRAALADAADTAALVSVMWANNEVGTVQPIAELAAIAAGHGVPFHTDAVQAVGVLPVDFGRSGAGGLTLTGHKLGGPVGAGALVLGRDVACAPLLHGGGQEREVRSGTLNTAAIVGLAVATEAAVQARSVTMARVSGLRDELVAGVLARVPDALLSGDPVDRLPGNAHFAFPGCEGDSLLMLLDARGVECSTGSACSAGVARPSHVLTAMGVEPSLARGSLRFSLGHSSTGADVDALLSALPGAVERSRRAVLASASSR
jgi:cysteine desulfurase